MSEKGNFAHNKYGCDDGETLDDTSLVKVVDHDYPNNTEVIICDSTTENVDYINSIQDGFQQSELLCDFVCDTGLQSDELPLENSPMEVESIQDSDNHIKFQILLDQILHVKLNLFQLLKVWYLVLTNR
ncbi:zinc finger X-linked protein ZXDB [Caerostris extrusa]|uniref:Zinc finger X-linked protein ZXDB n=1 Tax=Caerostris extrusa TaxID=172846 RepID=A0AAV4VT66_CAEEX|nr:zinc finger X-linked protein ZXDB [Caerostris extrusa]